MGGNEEQQIEGKIPDDKKDPLVVLTEEQKAELTYIKLKQSKGTKLETAGVLDNVDLTQTIKEKFGNLKFSKGLGESKESVDLFADFVSKLPPEEQGKLKEIFNENEDELSFYFENNGFIVNNETYSNFKSKFNIDLNVNKESDKKDIAIKEKVNQINSIWGEVRGKDGFQEFSGIFSKIQNLDLDKEKPEDLLKITEDFKNELTGEKLKRFLNLLKETDKKEGKDPKMEGSLYKSVCGKLSNLDSGFAEKIRSYENVDSNLHPETPSLKEFQIKGFFPKDKAPELSGDYLKVPGNGDGDQLIDLSKNPPLYLIGEEKGYKIEVDASVGEYYPATVEFEKVRQVEGPIFEKLGALKEFLEKLDPNLKEEALPGIKEQIKNILPYNLLLELGGVDNINSIQQLKEFQMKVWERYEDAKDKLEKAKKKYEEDLADKLEDYRKNTEAKNEKVREVYKFLKSIGFDLLSQDITDKLIEELNINSTLRLRLGFNSKIDLKNGNLGFDNALNNKNLGAQEKSTFAKFFNKIISGSFEEPVNIGAINSGTTVPVKDIFSLKNLINSGGFNDPGTGLIKLRKNLEKQEVDREKVGGIKDENVEEEFVEGKIEAGIDNGKTYQKE